MNKTQLIEAIGERIGDRKMAEAALNAFAEVVGERLAAGEKVCVTKFGTFKPRLNGGGSVKSGLTGKAVVWEAHWGVAFKPGSDLKAAVAARKL